MVKVKKEDVKVEEPILEEKVEVLDKPKNDKDAEENFTMKKIGKNAFGISEWKLVRKE